MKENTKLQEGHWGNSFIPKWEQNDFLKEDACRAQRKTVPPAAGGLQALSPAGEPPRNVVSRVRQAGAQQRGTALPSTALPEPGSATGAQDTQRWLHHHQGEQNISQSASLFPWVSTGQMFLSVSSHHDAHEAAASCCCVAPRC